MLICLSHLRFDCKVTPRYFGESFFKRVTMKFICKSDRFLFLSYAKDITFIWMEAHAPVMFPFCSCIKVLLEFFSIINRVYLFVYDCITTLSLRNR